MTSVAEGCPANQCDGCGECSTPMRARGWHGDQDVFGVDGGESAGESGRPEGVLMGARARSAWQRSSPTAAEEGSRHLPLRLPVAFPRPFWRPPPLSSSPPLASAPSPAATASPAPATASSPSTPPPPTIHHQSALSRKQSRRGNLPYTPSRPRVRRNHSACLCFPARSATSSRDTPQPPRYQASSLVITLFIHPYRPFK